MQRYRRHHAKNQEGTGNRSTGHAADDDERQE